jgi:hypothetical protein
MGGCDGASGRQWQAMAVLECMSLEIGGARGHYYFSSGFSRAAVQAPSLLAGAAASGQRPSGFLLIQCNSRNCWW